MASISLMPFLKITSSVTTSLAKIGQLLRADALTTHRRAEAELSVDLDRGGHLAVAGHIFRRDAVVPTQLTGGPGSKFG
ncbi:hypothetical protein [Streptomyces xanthochromogenes]|uniref:hypothetical protein n=1 Tax=Streptomyces xanthochromogenes TaxID=67384 RepID=UPI0034471B33